MKPLGHKEPIDILTSVGCGVYTDGWNWFFPPKMHVPWYLEDENRAGRCHVRRSLTQKKEKQGNESVPQTSHHH